jgi:L-threonylcarbamoyladenylate synthase
MAQLTDSPRLAARCIAEGGIIAYPTEAVFGLGCLPAHEHSIARLRNIKQRPDDQGLILVADHIKRLQPYLHPLTPRQQSLIQTRRQRATTWLVPASRNCPYSLRGQHDRLAIRLIDHPLVIELCRLTQSALISTSANRRGQPPARSASQVMSALGSDIDCVLAGPTGSARVVSEIRDIDTGTTYR